MCAPQYVQGLASSHLVPSMFLLAGGPLKFLCESCPTAFALISSLSVYTFRFRANGSAEPQGLVLNDLLKLIWSHLIPVVIMTDVSFLITVIFLWFTVKCISVRYRWLPFVGHLSSISSPIREGDVIRAFALMPLWILSLRFFAAFYVIVLGLLLLFHWIFSSQDCMCCFQNGLLTVKSRGIVI